MSPVFVKLDTDPGEFVAFERSADGKTTITTSDGVESSSVTLSLEQMRLVLALFPELTRQAHNLAVEEVATLVDNQVHNAKVSLSAMRTQCIRMKWRGIQEAMEDLAEAVRAMVKP